MINDDVLRKWSDRRIEMGDVDLMRPFTLNRLSRIHKLKVDILRIKLGFRGIGNRHMSLIEAREVKRGDKVIWDYYLDNNAWDDKLLYSPKIFQIISRSTQGDPCTRGILLGVGEGPDTDGDPNRVLQIGRTYNLDNLDDFNAIIRLDSMGRYKKSDLRCC